MRYAPQKIKKQKNYIFSWQMFTAVKLKCIIGYWKDYESSWDLSFKGIVWHYILIHDYSEEWYQSHICARSTDWKPAS